MQRVLQYALEVNKAGHSVQITAPRMGADFSPQIWYAGVVASEFLLFICSSGTQYNERSAS